MSWLKVKSNLIIRLILFEPESSPIKLKTKLSFEQKAQQVNDRILFVKISANQISVLEKLPLKARIAQGLNLNLWLTHAILYIDLSEW